MTSPVGASAGGRFRLPAPPPGEPDGTFRLGELTAPGEPGTPPSPRPTAPANRCGEPARSAGHPGVATVAPASEPPPPPSQANPRPHRGDGSSPAPAAASPREPGWPSARRDHRRSAPFLGSRWACALRYEAHSAGASSQVKGYFRSHRVIHRTSPQSPGVAQLSTAAHTLFTDVDVVPASRRG